MAVVLHNLLYGSAIASVDVGGYMPLSLAADPATGSAYVSGPDGSFTIFSTKNGANMHTTPAPPGRPSHISFAVAPTLGRVYVAHCYNTLGFPGDESVSVLHAAR